MPPIPGHGNYKWSRFELQTMLALMARGVHLAERPSREDDIPKGKFNTYLNFATELNHALHGTDYKQDIPKREVAKMLDKMLTEKKAVVGKGGLMERQQTGRLTRELRMAWECNRKRDFDGSLSEWNAGRKDKEIEKLREKNGFPPEQPHAASTPAPYSSITPFTSKNRIYKRPGRNSAAASSRYKSTIRVVSSDEEEAGIGSYIPVRICSSGKDNISNTGNFSLVSKDDDSYHSPVFCTPACTDDNFCPGQVGPHPRTYVRDQVEDQSHVMSETPSLSIDKSSPEENLSASLTSEAVAASGMSDEDLRKAFNSDIISSEEVDMSFDEDEVAKELDMQLNGELLSAGSAT